MTPARVPVAVLGATGIVGQSIVRRLADHPWFRLAEVVGSPRRVGTRYSDTVDWCLDGPMPPTAASLVLQGEAQEIRSPLVLSALPASSARTWERRLAGQGKVVSSNASAFRMAADVPLVVPEVNADAITEGERQEWAPRGGLLVTNPNCVVAGVAIPVGDLHRAFGIESVVMVTLQAVSGAGLSGPTALTMAGNVVPWIEGEEEKIAGELGKIVSTSFPVSVGVNRVPVLHGHMAHLFVQLARDVDVDSVHDLFATRSSDIEARIPSLPRRPVVVFDALDRPQPRTDIHAEDGMRVSVGRLRRTRPGEIALTVVSHNLERGAAGACLANAELAWRHRLNRARTPPGASTSGPSPSRPSAATPRR